ncbi:MAG TPA: VanZ family protein [Gemmata sp.]
MSTEAPRPPAPEPLPPGPPPDGLGTGRGDRFRFVVFAAFLGLWTWKLLEPIPVPEALTADLGADWRFVLAKALHAGAYAFLTVLVHALPVSRRGRWALVALLALHGAATEIGQTFVPNRSGSPRDVLIDVIGIGCGLFVCHAARKACGPRPGAAGSEPRGVRSGG